MDKIRDSFSRVKKKIKHRITGSKRKPAGTGPGARGEGVDPSGSLPRPEPRVEVSGDHDRGGDGANTGGRQAYSTDLGSREVDIGGGGFDVESAIGSRHSGEVERVYPSVSTPPIPSSGKPDGV